MGELEGGKREKDSLSSYSRTLHLNFSEIYYNEYLSVWLLERKCYLRLHAFIVLCGMG